MIKLILAHWATSTRIIGHSCCELAGESCAARQHRSIDCASKVAQRYAYDFELSETKQQQPTIRSFENATTTFELPTASRCISAPRQPFALAVTHLQTRLKSITQMIKRFWNIVYVVNVYAVVTGLMSQCRMPTRCNPTTSFNSSIT